MGSSCIAGSSESLPPSVYLSAQDCLCHIYLFFFHLRCLFPAIHLSCVCDFFLSSPTPPTSPPLPPLRRPPLLTGGGKLINIGGLRSNAMSDHHSKGRHQRYRPTFLIRRETLDKRMKWTGDGGGKRGLVTHRPPTSRFAKPAPEPCADGVGC